MAQYRDRRCRATYEVIEKSLEGTYRNEHLFELNHAVELYDFYSAKIAECDNRINELYQKFTPDSSQNEEPPTPPAKAQKYSQTWEKLYQLCGVDLVRINGLNVPTVQTVITEIGTDMSKWPSFKHFASWLGTCPNNKITGGQIIATTRKKTTNRAKTALHLAAQILHFSKSALGAYYRNIKSRCGPKIATKATANKLARIIYTMFKNKVEFESLDEYQYEQQSNERSLRNLKSKAAKLGFDLVPKENLVPTMA